jgi:hypothetical protein
MQKVEISVRESYKGGYFLKNLRQKVKISVRESCVEVHTFARLTPTQKGLHPPEGAAPRFF